VKIFRTDAGLVRWRIAVFVVGASLLGLVWVWIGREANRQDNFVMTYGVAGLSAILLLLWLLFFSGFRWKTRFSILGAVVLAGALGAGLFRVRGVTGDLVPILQWRFAPKADSTLRVERPPQTTLENRRDGRRRRPGFDYPQFLGPDRNATVRGVRLEKNWISTPPRLLWKKRVGAAWSAFSVSGDSAFTQEQRGEEEMVTCYDLHSGALHWSHSDPTRYGKVIGGVGPRATPTVTEDRVYTMGATGVLNCLNRFTGKRHWMHPTLDENRAKLNSWGMSGSPLVHDNLVIVLVGGEDDRSMVAYETQTGEPVWHGGHDNAGYSSPLHAVLAGVPQILALNHSSVVAHDPRTGELLWEQPWPDAHPNVAQPLPLPGDRVLVSSGYDDGCALFQVKKAADGGVTSEEIWKTRSLKAKFANFVHHDGFVYGLDDGILVCLDLETGKRRWKQGRYGHGQMILVEDLLLVLAESGEVLLLDASTQGHRILGRFGALDDQTWNSPALAAPYLLVRNDREAACYELPLATPLDR